MKLKIPVLLGTIRTNRKSAHAAQYILQQLQAQPNIETNLIDLNAFDIPMMEERMSAMETVPAGLQEFSNQLVAANGLIIVAPEYKNSYPGSLKNAFDTLDPQILKRTPISICTVSSGGFGGVNCLAQLRLLCLALGGLPLPGKLPISKVNDVFSEEGELLDQGFEGKVKTFLAEIMWYTEALAQK